jgi:hypothetical protein
MPPYSQPTQLQLSRRQELRTMIEQLQGTRATVHRMKAELEELGQRTYLPLPPELMGMIFDFCVHLYRQLPEKFLLVCRSWHVLALSQPSLWTNLNPPGQFQLLTVRPWAGTFLQSRIARSNPAPLTVNFKNLWLDMTPGIVRKVAAIPTFRSRIQELVISRAEDLHYLVGDQPLLKSLTFSGNDPLILEQLVASPKRFKLAEKKITTLRLDSSPSLQVWPDSLLQRLQTIKVTLNHDPQALWTTIQMATSLHTLHIVPSWRTAPSLSHPSVQCLSIFYLDTNQPCSLEEMRLPCLQDLTISTSVPKPLTQLKLVESPVSSLRLICRPRWSYGTIDPAADISWVNGVVCLLRSTPLLKRMEISAPSSLVSGVLEAFEKDRNLCSELNAFIVDGRMGIVAVKRDDKRNFEARFDELRSKAATFMDKR